MWTYFGVLLAIWPLLVEADLLFENINGWLPVRSEIVLDQIKHEKIPVPNNIANNYVQLLYTDINKALPHHLARPEKIGADMKENVYRFYDKCATKDNANCNQPKLINKPIQDSQANLVANYFQHTTNQNGLDHENLRRSKKITNINFRNYAQELFLPETSTIKTKERTYEVTEDISELDDIKTDKEVYQLEPQKKKNQTNGLFEILSKYKINQDDELPNYVISRNHKAQNPSRVVDTEKKQIGNLNRYNNLNHLPVDPLLAVFLSNYGFYLQGMYGVQNRYNNLYRYLASNNIHNNRPFGVYKIYSDTDSSH